MNNLKIVGNQYNNYGLFPMIVGIFQNYQQPLREEINRIDNPRELLITNRWKTNKKNKMTFYFSNFLLISTYVSEGLAESNFYNFILY